MKAIQFKKSDCQLSGTNHQEICKQLDCEVEFIGGIWNVSKIAKIKTKYQEIYIQLGNWIVEQNGILMVLIDDEYKLLQLDKRTQDICEQLNDAVKKVIRSEQRQGGLLKPKE